MQDRAAQSGGHTLFIAGPNEFLRPGREDKAPNPETAANMIRAYKAMDYDAVLLSPAEDAWLRAAVGEYPDFFTPMGGKPRTLNFDKEGKKVAVLVFPYAQNRNDLTPQMRQDVTQTAAAAGDNADLVVGASAWEYLAEKEFLAQHAGLFHLVLSGGAGRGESGELVKGSSTLWMRSYTKGMRLLTAELPAWPEPTAAFDFENREPIRSEARLLGGAVESDPEISNLFSP